MFKVNINNTRGRPHWSILTQSKRLVPYQDFKIFIIANRQGIVQKSHNLLFHRDFWLLLDIFQSLYFSKGDMFCVSRRRKSRLVDIFVDKSHSLFCYVQFVQVHNQSTIFLFSIRFYSRFFLLPCLQEAIWNWRIMLTAPPSLWEHVESQFFSRCNADIFPSSVTPCARQLLCSHSPIENVLAQSGVSQYNSL